MSLPSYSTAMDDHGAYITISLDLKKPMELSDFAGFFAGLGSEFERYLKNEKPDISGTAHMYVREVRKGSIEADLIPSISDLIGLMDSALIVLGFSALFSDRIKRLVSGRPIEDATKSEIKDLTETVRGVAEDPDGSIALDSFQYESGIWRKKFSAKFTTKEARKALRTLEAQKRKLDETENADHPRILMTFTRPDVGGASVGKRSGERVLIEDLSDKPMALIYANDMVEQRLKHEIREAEFIFKKGFVVDVNVESRGGRPVAYAVTHVHQVFDLPDD